jgi:Flp pilus assembly pilin Flp
VRTIGRQGLPHHGSFAPVREGRHGRQGRLDSMRFARKVFGDCRGQDLAEYAMLISLITLALIAALTIIGSRISAMFTAVAGAF